MCWYVGPAVLEIVDPNQFGTIPKSSTTQALISMIHKWPMATDSTGAAVRIVLLDYRKAFDLIDHRILIQKIYSLRIPRGVVRWTCDFLIDRENGSSYQGAVSQSGDTFLQVFPKAQNLDRGYLF